MTARAVQSTRVARDQKSSSSIFELELLEVGYFMLILCLFNSTFWKHYNILSDFFAIFSLHMRRNDYLCISCPNSDIDIELSDIDAVFL